MTDAVDASPRRRVAVWRDGLRMAFGTLTVWPTKPPDLIDRRVAGSAMTWAPLAGAALAVALVPAWLVAQWRPVPGMLLGALVLAALAYLTRGIHLDGLADTVDGLAASWDRERALRIMRSGDVGPMGAATLALVLLIDAAALGVLLPATPGLVAAAVAVVTSRLTVTWACLPAVPSARAEGLGQVVSGSVPIPRAAAVTAAVLALGTVAETVSGGSWWLPAAVMLGAAASTGLLARRCIRRLGGMTGDVLGACVELSLAVGLTLAVLAGR